MDNWQFSYHQWNQDEEPLREALCVLGNGYFATRGAAEETDAGKNHYPGTYLAGGYNRLKSDISGRIIENEDLVNFPNWLCLTFKIEEDSSWFDLSDTEIISFCQTLDIKNGLLKRTICFLDKQKRRTTLKTCRMVSLDNPHLAAIKWELIPENWSGRITLRSGLDGSVKNQGVARYSELNSKHLNILEKGKISDDSIYLLAQTTQSRLFMAQAAKCSIFENSQPKTTERKIIQEDEKIFQEILLDVQQHSEIVIEKIVSIFSSHDKAICEPLIEAKNAIIRTEDFSVLLKRHIEKWTRLWRRFDMQIDAEGNSELLCRLHLFHLLQTCSEHTIDLDVGVPARGWHGEAYRGHIFWDELFIFPLLNMHIADLTHALLMYRYRRLPEARFAAREAGFKGAMFPWQSGSNGREESQIYHLNPASGEWIPDNTYLQRHVNAAIAYNVWQYFEVTGNLTFMLFFGAELLLEIAWLFSSITTYDAESGKFMIKGIVGPDEFHTTYPNADTPGINNNAYTNFMAVWIFIHALKILELIGEVRRNELLHELEISEDEIKRWEEISRKMYIPFTPDGIINQFDGYEQLKPLDPEKYLKKYGSIHRLDRILDAEGDDVNRYKTTKQPDVLMLFYLFDVTELVSIFKRLGYQLVSDATVKHIEYYVPNTTLGSSLSHIVLSWVAASCDRKKAWNYFTDALRNDLNGSTTSEGIHLGSMAGTVNIIQRCFTGLYVNNDTLWLNPLLPDELKSLRFKINYRGCWLVLSFNHKNCTVFFERGAQEKISLKFKQKGYSLSVGEKKVFTM